MFLAVGLFFFIFTFITVYFSKKILKKFKIFDFVNNRSSHLTTKIRGGGIAFLFTGSILFISQGLTYPLICIPFGIIGFLDDIFKYSV